MKIVINKCYGGFGLSEKAYEYMIKLGIPVKKYIKEKRGKDGLVITERKNKGIVIFDRFLSKGEEDFNEAHISLFGRYWDTWTRENRTNEILVKTVEKLGAKASNSFANLVVIEIPNKVKWEINNYDGFETVHEKHRSW